MAFKYSRLESVEEKKNFRSAFLFIFISIASVIGLIVLGIPNVGKVATFVSGLRGVSSSIQNDKTPPAPPRLDTMNDFTNQPVITVAGAAEPGATIKLTFNGVDQETLVDKDGNFSFSELKLLDGENTIVAIAKDPAGNLSQKSVEKKITFDKKAPDLNIDSPSDGSSYYGSEQRQATIQGTTDGGSNVTINDRITSVDETGKFQYTLTLSPGENKFVVKSTDPAGNTTEKNLTLNFSE